MITIGLAVLGTGPSRSHGCGNGFPENTTEQFLWVPFFWTTRLPMAVVFGGWAKPEAANPMTTAATPNHVNRAKTRCCLTFEFMLLRCWRMIAHN
jgi:hypothetical protein